MNVWTGVSVLFQPSGQGGGMSSLIIMAAFIAIFYFLLIRPQRVQQKKHEEFVKGLKRGDEVSTVGGLIGEIVHLKDDRVVLKTGENTRVTVERDKILRRVGAAATETTETS